MHELLGALAEVTDFGDDTESTYRVALPRDDDVYRAKRISCSRDPHANPRLPEEHSSERMNEVEGGSRWVWIDQYTQ